MNFQPLVDNLPYIICALGLLLWALAKVIEAYSKKNPAIDKWDARAEQLHMIADKYSQAVEWLVAAGVAKWSGAQKLEEVNRRVREFEADWDAGNYLEALSKLSGFYQSAKSKVEKVAAVTLPFAPRPSIVTSPVESGSFRAQVEIGPDSPAVEDSNGK